MDARHHQAACRVRRRLRTRRAGFTGAQTAADLQPVSGPASAAQQFSLR
jgi:hypothetical protein